MPYIVHSRVRRTVTGCSSVSYLSKKRKYEAKTRVLRKKKSGVFGMKRRWKELLQSLSMNELKIWDCCKSRRWLSVANIYCNVERMMHFRVQECRKWRRVALGDMLTSDESFMHDGKPVCSEFSKKELQIEPGLTTGHQVKSPNAYPKCQNSNPKLQKHQPEISLPPEITVLGLKTTNVPNTLFVGHKQL